MSLELREGVGSRFQYVVMSEGTPVEYTEKFITQAIGIVEEFVEHLDGTRSRVIRLRDETVVCDRILDRYELGSLGLVCPRHWSRLAVGSLASQRIDEFDSIQRSSSSKIP